MARDPRLSHLNDADERMSMSRVLDLSERACSTGLTGYTHFLNPRAVDLATDILKGMPDIQFEAWGGYPDAERCVLSIGTERNMPFREDFPIRILRIRSRDASRKGLEHRDCLGAILSLGVGRERLGDIVIAQSGDALLAVHADMQAFLQENLMRVGRETVDVSCTDAMEEMHRQTDDEVVLVPSMRLDAVTAKGFALKRRDAEAFIRRGLVQVNWQPVTRKAANIREGDVVSCRGNGRIKVLERIGLSRRGQEKILIRRYR